VANIVAQIPILIPEGESFTDYLQFPVIPSVTWSSFTWFTQDRTGVANVDYVPASGTTDLVHVQTLDDAIAGEPDETFYVFGTATAVVQTAFGPQTFQDTVE